MSRAARSFAVALFALGGCQTPAPVVAPVSGRYEECEEPELQRAERALARGALEEAIAEYRALVEACPDYVPGHERYQDLAIRAGGETEASMRGYYARLGDDDSPVWPYVRARLEGEFDERRKELLEESLARDPSFYFAQLALARMWNGLGRTQNELAALESAIQAKSSSPDANLALGRVLSTLGRVEEAVPHYRNYLAQRPGDRDATRELVRLLVYETGDHAAAVPWIERLLADEPEEPSILMDAAAIDWMRGDREAAAARYRQVLALDPSATRAALNLGNLYFLSPDRPDVEKRSEWPKAREAYRTFLAIAEPQDLQDLLDVYTAVPYRLARIDEFLGPTPEEASGAPPERP